ncbi:ProQ/FinO family protein [Pseudomonas sp. S1(2024)]|uniref:ProQ/FinO family protein n=1 Tax=Pseudomonas sp. S1(2024) TaxID=3390191 RepID=UPI003978FE1D
MPAKKKLSPEQMEQLVKTLATFNEHFPKAFPKKGELPVRPLAISINRQIMAKVKEQQLGLTWNQVRIALAYWCSRKFYLNAFKKATHRIDLNGEVAESLTPEHQKYAKERFKRLMKRSETKNHEAPTSLQNAQSINDEQQAADKADHDAAMDEELRLIHEAS